MSSKEALTHDAIKVAVTDEELDLDEKEKSPSPVETDFSEATLRDTEQFLKLMDSHKRFARNYSTELLDLRAKHSWDDMLKAAESAQQTYEKAGFARKAGRLITSRSEMALPFTKLIPNDSYASVLYGGLRLVFEAFAQIDERRSKVLKSFLRIPNIILLAEGCVRNFPMDSILYERAEEVFRAALPAIEGAISWISSNPAKKPFKAIFLGPTYNRTFKEKLQNLDEALGNLQDRTVLLRDKSLQDTKETVDNVHRILHRTDTQMYTLKGDIENMAKTQDETHEKVNHLHDLEQVRQEAKEAMRLVLHQKFETAQWMKQKERMISRMQKHIEALQQADVFLTQEDLLDIIGVDPKFVSEDLRMMQKACQSPELNDLGTTRTIIESTEISDWIHLDKSAAQFLESDDVFATYGRITPFSLLCVEMIRELQDKEPAVPIYYFCGSHTTAKDSMRGPAGIMRSFICQILRLFSPKLDFISRRIRQQLETLDVHMLGECFCKLVKRLPHDAILFCIIDGISFFEKTQWIHELREMISQLQSLLDDEDLNPVFKLLVTSPGRTRIVRCFFPKENIKMLGLRQNVDEGRTYHSERDAAIAGARAQGTNRMIGRGIGAPLRRRRYWRNIAAQSQEATGTEQDSDLSEEEDGSHSEMDVEMERGQVAQPAT